MVRTITEGFFEGVSAPARCLPERMKFYGKQMGIRLLQSLSERIQPRAPHARRALRQMPGDGGMPGRPGGRAASLPAKSGAPAKRCWPAWLALVLVACGELGGGFAGYLVASKNGGRR